MTTELAELVGPMMGSPPVYWQAVGGGWTQAARWVVQLADGRSVFVKAATDADTARWLRAERRVYEALSGPFMPVCLGWEDGEQPVLLLEDLSRAHWPPPWNSQQIDALLAALEAVRRARIAIELPALADMRGDFDGWTRVAADPRAFLALGLCSSEWLASALPALRAAEAAAVLEGDDLLHLDVRSDNICLDGARAVLVDWNWACRGNGLVDVAGWLPSLRAERGPLPEAILPDQPELAALLSGYWAYRAGLPPPGPGGRVREVQLKQLRTALPWAARALGLPPLEERR